MTYGLWIDYPAIQFAVSTPPMRRANWCTSGMRPARCSIAGHALGWLVVWQFACQSMRATRHIPSFQVYSIVRHQKGTYCRLPVAMCFCHQTIICDHKCVQVLRIQLLNLTAPRLYEVTSKVPYPSLLSSSSFAQNNLKKSCLPSRVARTPSCR